VTAKGSQYPIVTTASSYLSSCDKRVHFGLGAATVAEMIELRWPSGICQTLKNVCADQILQIDEAPAEITGEGTRKQVLAGKWASPSPQRFF
jgi:hypothetical protein